jgi:uncharacterized protein
MSPEEALLLLKEVGCPGNVVDHCVAVSETGVALAKNVQADHPVDIHLVEIGGLLHDIGRAVTHGIDHGIVGAELLRERGINGPLQRICECHVCAGIPKEVAAEIGLPPRDFVPETLEEKIVCHADNLTNHTVEELRQGWLDFFGRKNGRIIVQYLDSLHKELSPYLVKP